MFNLSPSGPSHPWLVRAYAESVPYPSGTIFGQDMFQCGIIPSDTDFRIYRDFGEVPGLDIAYISNGYVYHTPNDKNKFIQPGCVQRGGNDIILKYYFIVSVYQNLSWPAHENSPNIRVWLNQGK